MALEVRAVQLLTSSRHAALYHSCSLRRRGRKQCQGLSVSDLGLGSVYGRKIDMIQGTCNAATLNYSNYTFFDTAVELRTP